MDAAVVSQAAEACGLVAKRLEVCSVLNLSCEALRGEWNVWSKYVHVDIRPIVKKRTVLFCRDSSFTSEFSDSCVMA